MSILNFFKLSYYFDSYINPDFRFFWLVVALLAAMFLATIVMNIRIKPLWRNWSGEKRFWWTHWSNLAYTISIVSLVHLFLRYQLIPYVNWRFWPLLLVIIVLIWLGYLVYYRRKIQPQKHIERESRKSLAYYFRRRRKK
ncbi:TPA: hypothetical protein DIV45_00125 [Patescibacteria group bacterium]|uniref:Uncharacterized protein n=1 Tax=candidate division Kazan bacterium GW2011_GWA1_44_22 TaxID=1620410 RepID=A0A0G1K8B4_UNCK3|nr:MAG: hypothetical protein VE96_C0018G0002 [candidate division Kazan bacterium GW2011_GWA1_44_22]HCR41772.1 hypothetical protein [Patescibacteria group bacterium]